MGSNSVKSIKDIKKLNKKELQVVKSMDASCHAETGLLKRIFRNLSKNRKDPKPNKYCLIVQRYDKLGNLANAKPCSVCCPIIKISGIKDIWYSTEEGFKYADGRTIVGEDSSGTRLIAELNQ